MKQNKSEHLQICEKRFFRFGSSVPSVRTWELLYMMLAYSDNSHEEIKDYYRSGNLPPSPPHRHPPVELIIGGSPLQWETNVHLPHRDLKDLVKETKLCVIGNGKLVLVSKKTGMVSVPLQFYYAIGVYMLVLNPTDEILIYNGGTHPASCHLLEMEGSIRDVGFEFGNRVNPVDSLKNLKL